MVTTLFETVCSFLGWASKYWFLYGIFYQVYKDEVSQIKLSILSLPEAGDRRPCASTRAIYKRGMYVCPCQISLDLIACANWYIKCYVLHYSKAFMLLLYHCHYCLLSSVLIFFVILLSLPFLLRLSFCYFVLLPLQFFFLMCVIVMLMKFVILLVIIMALLRSLMLPS